jgi:hypothetical protein
MASTAGLEHLRELISEHKTQQGIPAVLSGWLGRIEQDCSKRSKPRQTQQTAHRLDYAERLVRRH